VRRSFGLFLMLLLSFVRGELLTGPRLIFMLLAKHLRDGMEITKTHPRPLRAARVAATPRAAPVR
jgi:hypothetical protein